MLPTALLSLSLSSPLLSRRAILAPLSALPFALPQTSLAASGRSPVRDGMTAFAAGKVEESIEMFDEVIRLQPGSKPYLWQRGLSLYYAERFADGAEQFAADVAVNPNDTEEAIWHMLCLAKLRGGVAAARKDMLKVGRDRRPVMRAALELFEGSTDEAPLLKFTEDRESPDFFYATLYLGLYREASGDAEGARRFMREAVGCRYAKGTADYMADLARVHVGRRGWT